MSVLKAKLADKWIVLRHSPIDAPNYFVTTNFKDYKRLTNLQPQKAYNWLSSELVTWKQLDGTDVQGKLYKPENFNESKKYPVIINYYEDQSDGVYHYLSPYFSGNPSINIPWFVSRGYVVFVPDINHHTTMGKTGQTILNSVVSGARYLSEMSWVDPTKMAICGSSFGGFETNFLLTHTNLICSSSFRSRHE